MPIKYAPGMVYIDNTHTRTCGSQIGIISNEIKQLQASQYNYLSRSLNLDGAVDALLKQTSRGAVTCLGDLVAERPHREMSYLH